MQGSLVIETVIERVAAECDLDPAAVRLKNMYTVCVCVCVRAACPVLLCILYNV